MRPMTVMASVFFASLVVATVEVGCSSDDSSTPATTPYDSGSPPATEASVSAGSVTVAVSGPGFIVSGDGTPSDGGPNGFIGPDGGAPMVDCPGTCTAPQGITLYAVPVQGNMFAGWSVIGAEGGATISTSDSLQITPAIGTPLTATFVATISGLDAAAAGD
jgi:hypothetical protein